jgi:hypothetical protein
VRMVAQHRLRDSKHYGACQSDGCRSDHGCLQEALVIFQEEITG